MEFYVILSPGKRDLESRLRGDLKGKKNVLCFICVHLKKCGQHRAALYTFHMAIN